MAFVKHGVKSGSSKSSNTFGLDNISERQCFVFCFFLFWQADEGDSGNGSQGFRMPTSKKGSAAVAGFTLRF